MIFNVWALKGSRDSKRFRVTTVLFCTWSLELHLVTILSYGLFYLVHINSKG
jgi:hypothetical protein